MKRKVSNLWRDMLVLSFCLGFFSGLALAETQVLDVPTAAIQSVALEEGSFVKLLLPLQNYANLVEPALYYDLWLEFPVSSPSGSMAEVGFCVCPENCTDLPGEVDWTLYQSLWTEETSPERVQFSLRGVLNWALENNYSTVTLWLGPVVDSENSAGRIWLPQEGGGPWQVIVSRNG